MLPGSSSHIGVTVPVELSCRAALEKATESAEERVNSFLIPFNTS